MRPKISHPGLSRISCSEILDALPHFIRSLTRMTVVIFIFVTFIKPPVTYAAGLTQVIVRFDRMKVSTPTTGLICAAPSTVDTENAVEVVFPAGFSVSTTLSNWTVSTSNIPAGATIWPGIGTATNVSGNTVTFPSSDIAVGTLYCFHWTNTNAITTSSSTTNTSGRVSTLNASSSTIDSKQYFLSLTNNDQVTLTATVTPNSSDIDFTLTGAPPDGTTLSEGQEVTFTINYRSDLAYTTDLQIVATWERGLINGSGSSYVDIFDYVVGSATTSDEGAVPTIDTVNRTITWDISGFAPSVSSHTVTFKLITQADFANNLTATAHVNAMSKIVDTTLHNRQLTYSIGGSIAPTSTPTQTPTPLIAPSAIPGSTSTPGPNPTSTPAPTTTPSLTPETSLKFKSVSISEITDTSFTINLTANKVAAYRVNYGTNRNKITEVIEDDTLLQKHTIVIKNLKPGTHYYYVITLIDSQGKTIKSDIFTVKTASGKSTLLLTKESTKFLSNNIIVSSPRYQTILMPLSLPISIQVSFDNPEIITSLEGFFRNNSVLGINTMNSPPPVKRTQFVEIHPGTFAADIQSPGTTGAYAFVLEVKDLYGGLYEKPIPYRIQVAQPISVIDKKTNAPVENAKVEITKYQESSRQYAPLSTIHSYPTFTDDNGQLPLILTQGSYIINVSSDRYLSSRIEYTVNDGTTQYPHFALEPNNGLPAVVTYYRNALRDAALFAMNAGSDFVASSRARDLLLFLLLIASVLLAGTTLSLRLNYGFTGIISAFLHSIHRKKTGPAIEVKNWNNHTIAGVKIYLLDNKNHLLYKTQTGLDGIVHIPNHLISLNSFPLKVMLYHPNYYTYPFTIDEQTFTSDIIPATLSSYEKEAHGKHLLHWFYDIALVSISDTLIVGSYVLTIMFMKVHGLGKTLPLLMASSLLMVIWLFFIKQIHRELKISNP